MINPFADLLKDTIFIQSQSGKKHGPFKTNLRKGRATIFSRNLDVAPGDQLIRPLSNEKEESYEILDFQFAEGMMDIPESYTFIISEDFTVVSPLPTKQEAPAAVKDKHQSLYHIKTALEDLTLAIDNSDNTAEEKIIAKSKIKELFDNRTVFSLLEDVPE